jgi:transposase-like protein
LPVDETYVGGKKRRGEGGPAKRGRGTSKIPVVGAVERGGKVVARPVKNVSAKTLKSIIRQHVDIKTATVITDEFRGYLPISRFVDHKTINHKLHYADGDIHTNNIESFWALLKRGLVGQYHKVSLRHLHEYVDEFCYRQNNRKNKLVFEDTITRALGGKA